MIDFWEMMGRMLTNDDFRCKVFDESQYSAPYELDLSARATIDKNDFATLRGLAKDVGGIRGPISLFALGEMLIAMRYKGFKPGMHKLAGLIRDVKLGQSFDLSSQGHMFYVALGGLALDSEARNFLGLKIPSRRGGRFGKLGNALTPPLPEAQKSYADYGFYLGGAEDVLTTIFNDDDVAKACLDLCDPPPSDCPDPTVSCDPWQYGCDVNMEFWPEYVHPVASLPTQMF